MSLHAAFDRSAVLHGERIALEDGAGGKLTYRELSALADRVRDRLHALGVTPGDRVGVHLPKSMDAVAAILGILRAGAAYVPVDAEAPAARAAFILSDCSVFAVFTAQPSADSLRNELAELGASPILLGLPVAASAAPSLAALLDHADHAAPAAVSDTVHPAPDDLAYILYTSGSTGRPKGVMLSHRCAESYVDWCMRVFEPVDTDRFSSHAPFHFDLSILDLYVPLGAGATLVLVGEAAGREPRALAPFIAEQRITVWYSVPSILSLLAQYGRLERHDYGALRLVLFAGEVFPIPRLRELQHHWPDPQYYNLYGPTETNVCTYYRVPLIGTERTQPLPIGRACEHLECRVVDAAGHDVAPGAEGELVVSGPAVMLGYWNLADRNAAAFLVDEAGRRWYRTGDLVVEGPDGYVFRGRRDRMVKRRGYRIELGEIEAGLALHPAVREVAVVALTDPDGVRIRAILSTLAGERPTTIALKQFCAEHLPRYMVPDSFEIVDALPRTATEKIDYPALSTAR